MKIIEGKTTGRGKRISIVVSKFNEFITKRLLAGCLKELARYGVNDKNITVVWVPGSFEIPVTACKLAKKKNVHAVICLGAVIRGETLHYELVARGVTDGIMRASLSTGKPVIFGVLATDTVDHAYKRSEEKGDNKGKDAAVSAIEMIDALKQVSASSQ